MIQVLTYSGDESALFGSNIKINKIHDAESLDSFSINIVSLQSQFIWFYRENNTQSINDIDDLKSLALMIKNSTHSHNIILLPQNEMFTFCTHYHSSKDWSKRELKNMIPNFKSILEQLYKPLSDIDIVYENTKTKIEDKELMSAFYFNGIEEDVLSKSMGSNKVTTIGYGDVILSTLNIKSYEELISFLRAINLIQDKPKAPKWMEDVKMFDDERQLEIIQENNKAIKVANDNITVAMSAINKNNEYKTILYTNGDELVKVVFEILENMLGCNLSGFQDEKKEDFLFDINGKIFIGEIKGVNHNVKNENISQLDVHYQRYFDEHEEADPENVKALLIMNHQKNKPLNQREKVHDQQIKLAERNKSLIIESMTLLKLFERYLSGDKTRDQCIEVLKSNVGLLKI